MVNKIMFVDDEKGILQALRRFFLDEPYEILVSDSPLKALEMLENNEVAVVVSDQRMPVMEGTEFLEKVRERWPNTVRIILTAYADLEAAKGAINRGNVYRFINKPWDDVDLKTAVKNAIDLYTLESENRKLFALTKEQNDELRELNGSLEIKVEERTGEIKGLLDDIRRGFSQMIRAFTGLIELFDPALGGHSKRVAVLAMKIGEQARMETNELQLMEISALLHDIGLVGLPRSILEKDESVRSQFETALIRQHPGMGHATLAAVKGLKDVAEIVHAHHENFDGKGYPRGLQNKEIPLGARIIRVAEDFDCLINKDGMSRKMTIEHLKKGAGREYDPRVVSNLLVALNLFNPRTENAIAVSLDTLKPGMVLAQSIKTGRNRLLLAESTILKAIHIDRLLKFHDLDPIVDRIKVYKYEKKEGL